MINFEKALSLLQASAHDFGIKELADVLNKGISTIYAELNETERYKLGAKDFFKIMASTGNMTPLESILSDMGFALCKLPDAEITIPPKLVKVVIKQLAVANKECSESFSVTLKAVEDGEISREEAVKGSNECDDAIKALVGLKFIYDQKKN